MQSQTERDMQGLAARREREAAPVESADDADSMAHDIEERRAIRAQRPTDKRLDKLEEFKDAALEKLGEIELTVADIRGDQKAAAVSLKHIESALERRNQDDDDARKHKRQRITAVIGGVFSAGVLGAIAHWWLS